MILVCVVKTTSDRFKSLLSLIAVEFKRLFSILEIISERLITPISCESIFLPLKQSHGKYLPLFKTSVTIVTASCSLMSSSSLSLLANKQKVTGSIPGETPKFALEGLKVLSLKLPETETNQQSAYSITWKKPVLW